MFIGKCQCSCRSDNACNIVCSATAITFLTTTKNEWFKMNTVAYHHHTHSLWTTELVCRQGEHIDMRPDVAQVQPASSLHRVGMQHSFFCTSAHGMGDVFDVVDCTCFVVDSHYRNNRHIRQVRKGLTHHIRTQRTLFRDGHNYSANMFNAMQHSVMFRCRTHCNTTRSADRTQDG